MRVVFLLWLPSLHANQNLEFAKRKLLPQPGMENRLGFLLVETIPARMSS
jgi:hypothetical protein